MSYKKWTDLISVTMKKLHITLTIYQTDRFDREEAPGNTLSTAPSRKPGRSILPVFFIPPRDYVYFISQGILKYPGQNEQILTTGIIICQTQKCISCIIPDNICCYCIKTTTNNPPQPEQTLTN